MKASDSNEQLLNSHTEGGGQKESFFTRIYTPRVVLVVFTLTNLMTYYDRGAIASVLSDVRSSPDIAGKGEIISQAKGGFIVSAFMIGFMITCPVFAGLGGKFTAKQIMVFGMIVWAAAAVLTGFSKSYAMILVSRMFVGVGEAAYVGFSVTIIDNIAPPSGRTRWIGIFYSMIPVGTALGMACAGVISSDVSFGNSFPGWRLVFFSEVIISAPIIGMLALMPNKYNPVKTEAKGEATPAGGDSINSDSTDETDAREAAALNNAVDTADDDAALAAKETEHISFLKAGKALCTNLNYLLLVFGYGMYVFVTGALAVWAISMLVQGPIKFDKVEASLFIGASVAFTGMAGSIIGGLFVDRMGGSQGTLGMFKCALFNSGCMAFAIPLGLLAMFSTSRPIFCVFFVAGVLFVFLVTAPVNCAILSSVPPELRTYAVSFSILFIHTVGDFPSPTVTGAISDTFSEGCPNFKNQTICEANTAKHCVWIPTPKHSIDNPYCTNEFQLRNALAIVFGFLFFAIPAWGVVAVRTRRQAKEEAASAAAGSVETGKKSSDVSMKFSPEDPQ